MRNILPIFAVICCTVFPAAGDPLIVTEEDVFVPLPGEASEALEVLEFSEDLESWQPLALRYGGAWETLFPDPRDLVSDSFGTLLKDPRGDRPRYFTRIVSATAADFSAEALAARFLRQTTFGPTREEIDALAVDLDFSAWIDGQMAATPTEHLGLWAEHPFDRGIGKQHQKGAIWMKAVLDGPDQLRQRVAWALAQIFVIGDAGSNDPNVAEQWTNYYDIFVRNAFGNYRDIMREVTLSPKMGDYLTYENNRKASGAILPDENYAREVMQLFTIGLLELNPDGTLMTDDEGEAIETYDNFDIETNARIFTGFVHADDRAQDEGKRNRVDPMKTVESVHDTGEKVLLDGTVLPAGGTVMEDVEALLDRLFLHPNTAPFVSRLLIQRLTGSNPSPAYIGRVSAVFSDNGVGVRGDLGAVVRAILLDPEARDARLTVFDASGGVREPLIRFTHYCRAFRLSTSRADGYYRIHSLSDNIKQFPYESPSVFNFYLPDHQPQGVHFERGLFSPELQILDDPAAVDSLNVFIELTRDGLADILAGKARSDGALDLTEEIALAGDLDALLDHLDLVLTAGTLGEGSREIIRDAVTQLPASDPEARVRRALVLFAATPEFATHL